MVDMTDDNTAKVTDDNMADMVDNMADNKDTLGDPRTSVDNYQRVLHNLVEELNLDNNHKASWAS